MKILMVNKFLHPNGGSETYIFKLGDCLTAQGHEVQYFGMEHEGRCVGNRVNAYTADMDFHGGSKLVKLTYPFKIIYSTEARKKIRMVLKDFQPDVVHLNNFTFQLTPSIILEIVKWRTRTGRECRIIMTAHDAQLVCPNHMLQNPNTHELCEQCLGGHFGHCTKGKCIHGSALRSLLGTIEAVYWNARKVYRYLDVIICPSMFLKQKLDTNPLLAQKTLAIHNFIDRAERRTVVKKDYVLYFGRYSQEKGIRTLAEACRLVPEIPFVFAGSGPLVQEVEALPNVQNVGFQTGEALDRLIREARFSLCPSEWHENCPFTVMESEERGTPVVGASVGGVPELIEDGVNGRLFERKNSRQLAGIIRELWESPTLTDRYAEECLKLKRNNITTYTTELLKLYEGNE